MKKVKTLIAALLLGTLLAVSGCTEEVILPDDNPGTSTQNDPDG